MSVDRTTDGRAGFAGPSDVEKKQYKKKHKLPSKSFAVYQNQFDGEINVAAPGKVTRWVGCELFVLKKQAFLYFIISPKISTLPHLFPV